MKKSFSTGVTGLKERARRIGGILKGDGKSKSARRRRDIEVSAPVQQVSGRNLYELFFDSFLLFELLFWSFFLNFFC